MKCERCGATENLTKTSWMGDRYTCDNCSMRPSNHVSGAVPSTASPEWLAREKETRLRILAKYAKP